LRILLTGLVVCLLQCSALAQQKIIYYTWEWKPCEIGNARFYSIIEPTDSGWLRNDYFINSEKLQMTALYEDEECKIQNGHYKYFHPNGSLSSIGKRVHGKREGICLRYHSNGMMYDSAEYHNNIPVGNSYRWHRNGFLSDSTKWINDSMMISVTWFDDGSPSAAGYLLDGKLHGKWNFYHKTGGQSAEEYYQKGTLISAVYYNEDGSILEDTSKSHRRAVFHTGKPVGWDNYLSRKIYWPTGIKLVNTYSITIVVEFTINEEGKVENAEVTVPFDPRFEEIALSAITECPDFLPALSHNRRIKNTIRQVFTFYDK